MKTVSYYDTNAKINIKIHTASDHFNFSDYIKDTTYLLAYTSNHSDNLCICNMLKTTGNKQVVNRKKQIQFYRLVVPHPQQLHSSLGTLDIFFS